MLGWCVAPGHKKRISETKGGGKAEKSYREQEDLPNSEWLHANQNHIGYGFYSNGRTKTAFGSLSARVALSEIARLRGRGPISQAPRA